MTQQPPRRLWGNFGPVQIGIIVLVIITALIHLQRGVGMGGGPPGGGPPAGGNGGPPGGAPGGGFNIMQALPLPLPTLFLLNGIGYLVLLVALYLPALRPYQRIVRWLLIAFAAVTIIMYFVVAGFRFNPIGLFDKVAELALIALLVVEDRQAARAPLGVRSPQRA